MKKAEKIIIENLEITEAAGCGVSLARHNGQVVFVQDAVPGDIADVFIIKKKKNYLEAKVERIVAPSQKRIEPRCKHFGLCGGCRWQYLDYAEQLRFKQNEVVENIRRIGKVENFEVLPILGSPEIFYYRNKLEFSFSNRRFLTRDEINANTENIQLNAVGFHVPKMFDKVLDIEECWLQPEPSNAIRNWIRNYALDNGLSFYDLRNHNGFLRNLIIRNNLNGDIMLILSFAENKTETIHKLLDELLAAFPQICSLYYVINTKANSTILDLPLELYHGKPYLEERIGDLNYRIQAKSFFQTNSRQTKALYDVVKEWLGEQKDQTVYDLYSGTGTISCYVARNCAKVIGIESVEQATEDAKANAMINCISNVDFVTGDMKEVLNEEFFSKYGRPDIIITDPPRDGMHKNVIQNILKASPERIIYVSCNSATQARDIELLSSSYYLVKIQPVDMFPHTYHVENVALLQRKS